jgi:hypothetical protein
MLVKHHNKTFKNEFITLNGNSFFSCEFIDCTLNCVDTGDDPDGFIEIRCCDYVNIKYEGDGWPYDLIDLLENNRGEPFTWAGKLGNKERVLH